MTNSMGPDSLHYKYATWMHPDVSITRHSGCRSHRKFDRMPCHLTLKPIGFAIRKAQIEPYAKASPGLA